MTANHGNLTLADLPAGADYLEFVIPCVSCDERFCVIHNMHWADCECPGPHETDEADEEDFSCPRRSELEIKYSRVGTGLDGDLAW